MSKVNFERLKAWHEQKERIEFCVRQLCTELNSYTSHDDVVTAFNHALLCEHRTLQQDFWRMMFDVMTKYGETQYFDGRNEQAVNLCESLSEHLTGLTRI